MDGPGWWDLLGLGVTAVGFLIAFEQLRRTRKAADAAASALGAAQVKLGGDALTAALPILRDLQVDLDIAIATNEADIAQRALVRFAHTAQEVASILKNVKEDQTDLINRVKLAGDQALDTKQLLAGKKNPDVARTVKSVSADIGKLSSELAGAAARIRFKLQEDPDVRR